MAIALEGMAKVSVRTLTRGFNQAAILVAEHQVKIDSAEALPVNTEVTYTDPELGFVFAGRITDRSELWRDGEAIVYTCADVFRQMVKEPARLNGSTRISIQARTSGKTLVEDILTEYVADGGYLPGGYVTTDLEDVQIEPIDMGGQSVFEWIKTVLDQTEDSVCWIDYTLGHDPYLRFARLSSITPLDLKLGTYSVLNPDEDNNPLIVEGDIADTLDNKYSRVEVEGCGDFERFTERYIGAPVMVKLSEILWDARWYIPEAWMTGRHFDENGKCRDWWMGTLQFGGNGDSLLQYTYFVPNVPVEYDGTLKQYYFHIRMLIAGIIDYTPPLSPVEAWFTYTGYVGPLVAARESSVFSNEGTYNVYYPDFVKYQGAVSVNDLPAMSAMADRFYERFCTEPDRSGSVTVHIKGLDTAIELGAKVVTPTLLAGPIIRAIRYEFDSRNISLDCSDEPMRPEITDAQMKARLLTEVRGGWYLPKQSKDISCMCDGDVSVDENGNARPPNIGGGDGVFSYDCVNGQCQERNDDLGQYRTGEECDRDCRVRGWDFVPCTGCIPTQNAQGQYETDAECVADNPNPFDAMYHCEEPSGGSAASQSAQSNFEYSCAGCSCGGDGDAAGKYFVGFIKRLKVSPSGMVITAECDTCEFELVSGWTGVVSVLANIDGYVQELTVLVLAKCWHVMFYVDGMLTSVGNAYTEWLSECGTQFKSGDMGSRGFLTVPDVGCGA